MRIKIRRTESQWKNILEAYDNSGKSQQDFCSGTGIPLSSFCCWRTKLKKNKTAGNSLVKIEKKKDIVTCGILIKTSYCQIAISGNENKRTLGNLFSAIREAEYAV